MDRHLDLRAVAGEVLVDGVIENFKNAVVKAAFIGIADIHSGSFADGLKTLQFVDLACIVFLVGADFGLGLFRLVGGI